MHSEPISTAVIEYRSFAELGADEQSLIIDARASTRLSHSPYSNYRVGCAIHLKDDRVVWGANQENASYGLTCCAERTTIFAVNNLGKKRDIQMIAVTARPAGADDSYVGTTPVAPCGACRQVIKESEDLAGSPIVILMDCYDDRRIARMVGISGPCSPLPSGLPTSA
jgi:cytidine deaminase